ncbi:MAG TPA: patatin-like phospholipase family protein [Kofleriaceae bacterium]|jgi:NTE family protein|nr:patatin-like phospholipase family protein [Kofleriaceae bacterium]
MKAALILGAGGPAAAAFEIGIIAGLADGGVDVRDADVFIGTSAGARIAVQLAGSVEINELFRRKLAPCSRPKPLVDMKRWGKQIAQAKACGGSATKILKRIGELALSVQDDPRADRAAQIAEREWPAKRVLLVSVECETGERRAFERASAAPLEDAIAASGALPGVWPPIEIGGRHYMDGGMYSTDNADLAAGFDCVLVIALRAGNPRVPLVGLEDTTRALAHVFVILPDDAAQAALAAVGGNVLDPDVSPAMALAARARGQLLATRIATFWQHAHAA